MAEDHAADRIAMYEISAVRVPDDKEGRSPNKVMLQVLYSTSRHGLHYSYPGSLHRLSPIFTNDGLSCAASWPLTRAQLSLTIATRASPRSPR